MMFGLNHVRFLGEEEADAMLVGLVVNGLVIGSSFRIM
jgi:hypothetical protein